MCWSFPDMTSISCLPGLCSLFLQDWCSVESAGLQSCWCSCKVSLSECRWSPKQALQHPFITRAVFTGPFQPTPDSPVLTKSPGLAYSSTSTANGYTAPVYGGPSSQGQSLAALASSPEARAQAHLAGLAAVAQQLSPHSSSFQPPASLPAAYQAAMLQQLDSAMQSASAGPMQMPALRPSSYYQHALYQQQQEQQQRQQQLQQQMMSEYASTHGGSQSGKSQRFSSHRHHTTGSDSTGSSIGGNFMPSMSAQQTLYGSYSQQQQQQQQAYQSSARFGSIPQSPVSVPMPAHGQLPGNAPVGSLEALRYGWHAPRGRTTYGDMFPSSLMVPSQRLAGSSSLAGSLGGSLTGSLGPPRLPPSLNNRSRHSFSSSPAGPSGAVLSPSLATPPMAGTPNRVLGFGTSAYSDQQPPQQLQQQLPRQQCMHQIAQALPPQQAHHRHQSSHEQIERLFDDWAGQGGGQGGDGGLPQHMSRQRSLDIPHPSDWDPNFRCYESLGCLDMPDNLLGQDAFASQKCLESPHDTPCTCCNLSTCKPSSRFRPHRYLLTFLNSVPLASAATGPCISPSICLAAHFCCQAL